MFIGAIIPDVRINPQSFIYCLMFISQADYLELHSACFEVTKDHGTCQDLAKSHPEDGPNYKCPWQRLVAK